MSPELMQNATLIVFVIAVAIMLRQQYQAGKTITVEDVLAAAQAAKPIADRLRTVAEGIVLANEQIKRDGKMTNTEAYQRAFAVIRSEFPLASKVTDAEIIREINRAVLLASNLTAQIEQAKSGRTEKARADANP